MSAPIYNVSTSSELEDVLKRRFIEQEILADEMYSASHTALPATFNDCMKLRVALKLQADYKEVKDKVIQAVSGQNGTAKNEKVVSSSAPSSIDSIVSAIQNKEEELRRQRADPFAISATFASSSAITQDALTDSTSVISSINPSDSTSYSSALVSVEDTLKPTQSKNASTFSLPASSSTALATYTDPIPTRTTASDAILKQRRARGREPEWHAPWKLKRVISGHQGWVYNAAVDPSNEWFVTCSSDRTMKIWDLASGTLKLTLTGHVASVRDVAISDRHPYLFSASEDREAKCWDLEANRVVRNYHGHLSGVYAVEVHPTLDLVITGGRDSSCRVWDMRMKNCVRTLVGHRHTVSTIGVQGFDPQIVTGSYDATVKLWDLRAGRALTTLTHHKKSVRAVAIHHTENAMVSASTDNIKTWKLPEGTFMRNAEHAFEIVNGLAINRENVLAAGSDVGRLELFDWTTGRKFQDIISPPQPGSLPSERGIFGVKFDMTGTRLITTEADKTIKIYQPDENATPLTHPVVFDSRKRARF